MGLRRQQQRCHRRLRQPCSKCGDPDRPGHPAGAAADRDPRAGGNACRRGPAGNPHRARGERRHRGPGRRHEPSGRHAARSGEREHRLRDGPRSDEGEALRAGPRRCDLHRPRRPHLWCHRRDLRSGDPHRVVGFVSGFTSRHRGHRERIHHLCDRAGRGRLRRPGPAHRRRRRHHLADGQLRSFWHLRPGRRCGRSRRNRTVGGRRGRQLDRPGAPGDLPGCFSAGSDPRAPGGWIRDRSSDRRRVRTGWDRRVRGGRLRHGHAVPAWIAVFGRPIQVCPGASSMAVAPTP